jgi:hypothetical protein
VSHQPVPAGHSCSEPATVVLEGYSPSSEGLVRGALECTVFVCDQHAHAARTGWFPGMTPFTALGESAGGRRCGEVL